MNEAKYIYERKIMKEITRTVTVDLARQSNTRLVFTRQNDMNSRRLCIILTDGGKPYIVPKECVAVMKFRRADGTASAFYAEVGDDGCVYFTLNKWALEIVGQTRCSVALYGEDEMLLSSADFYLDVVESLYLGDNISSDEGYSLLTSLLSEVSGYKAAELAREEAEEERIAEEEVRAQSEELRALSEQTRVSNELGRRDSEAQRAAAERERAEGESARQTAEGARASAEAAREQAELARALAEKAREEKAAKLASAESVKISDSGGYYDSGNVEGALSEIGISISDLDARLKTAGGIGGQLTLAKDSWAGKKVQAITIPDLTDRDMISFAPMSAADRTVCSNHGLFISPLTNGREVEISVDAIPDSDIALCYFICRGAV